MNERATWTVTDPGLLDIDELGSALGKMAGASSVTALYQNFKVTTTALVISANGCNSLDTYRTKVEPIFQSHCLGCHGRGERASLAFLLRGPNPSADDIVANWNDTKKRIDHADAAQASLLQRSLSPTHPGNVFLQPTSQNHQDLTAWVNIEAGCQLSIIPSNLGRSSGEALVHRMAALFPTAVSDGLDEASQKPLFHEEFDVFRAQWTFRLVEQPERSFSPLAQVLWRNLVNRTCSDYIRGDEGDLLLKWIPDLLLMGESVPSDPATSGALAAARRAWLHLYGASSPEVLALRDLYAGVYAEGDVRASFRTPACQW